MRTSEIHFLFFINISREGYKSDFIQRNELGMLDDVLHDIVPFGKIVLGTRTIPTIVSKRWLRWKSILSDTTCKTCRNLDGTIYRIHEVIRNPPPLHAHCHCTIIHLEAIKAGTATANGEKGVDWYVKTYGKLPPNYITKGKAERLGWEKELGNLNKVVPGKIIGGNIYRNKNQKLPQSLNRTWYEADLTYNSGVRNKARLLYSNDGLVFVTYDHYKTFYEIS